MIRSTVAVTTPDEAYQTIVGYEAHGWELAEASGFSMATNAAGVRIVLRFTRDETPRTMPYYGGGA